RFRNAVGAAARPLVAGLRPEHFELGGASEGTASVEGVAEVVEYLGNEELLHVTVPGHDVDVIAVVDASHNIKPGDILDLKLPAERLHLFDAESGDTILADARAAATPA
ncbi:MAG: TOBE domain-containing protein, partial [Candidatus Limnocylindrales bacterium]